MYLDLNKICSFVIENCENILKDIAKLVAIEYRRNAKFGCFVWRRAKIRF